MSGVNKVILIGRVGKDPETRYMPNGEAVSNLTLATSEKWKDKGTGEQKELTEWHRLVFFNKTAEVVGEYVKKGSLIYVEGKLQTRKWTNNDGVDQYTTEIKCHNIQMLDSKTGNQNNQQNNQQSNQNQQGAQNNQQNNHNQQNRNQQQGAQQGQGQSNNQQAGQYNKQAAQQAPDLDDGWDDDIPF